MLCSLFFCCKKEGTKHFNKNRNLDSLIVVANNSLNSKTKEVIADEVLNEIEHDRLDSIARKRYISLAEIYSSINSLK